MEMEFINLILTEKNTGTKFTIITNEYILKKQEFYKQIYNGNLKVNNFHNIFVTGTIIGCQLFLYLDLFENQKDEKIDLPLKINGDDFDTFVLLVEPYGFVTTNDDQVVRLRNIFNKYGLLTTKISIEYFHELQTWSILQSSDLLNEIKVANKFINTKKFYFTMNYKNCSKLFSHNLVDNNIYRIYDDNDDEIYCFSKIHLDRNIIRYFNGYNQNNYYFDRTINCVVKYEPKYSYFSDVCKFMYGDQIVWLMKLNENKHFLTFYDTENKMVKSGRGFKQIYKVSNNNKDDTELNRYFYCSNSQLELCIIDLDDPKLELHVIGNIHRDYIYEHLKVSESGYLALYENRKGKYLYDHRYKFSCKIDFDFKIHQSAFSQDSTELIVLFRKNENAKLLSIYDITNIFERGIKLLDSKIIDITSANNEDIEGYILYFFC